MVLEAKQHREIYERQSYRWQNTMQGGGNVCRAKMNRSVVQLTFLEANGQKENNDKVPVEVINQEVK